MSVSRRGLFGFLAGAVAAPRAMKASAVPEGLWHEIEYASRAGVTRCYGYEMFAITRGDIISAAEFDWRPHIGERV